MATCCCPEFTKPCQMPDSPISAVPPVPLPDRQRPLPDLETWLSPSALGFRKRPSSSCSPYFYRVAHASCFWASKSRRPSLRNIRAFKQEMLLKPLAALRWTGRRNRDLPETIWQNLSYGSRRSPRTPSRAFVPRSSPRPALERMIREQNLLSHGRAATSILNRLGHLAGSGDHEMGLGRTGRTETTPSREHRSAAHQKQRRAGFTVLFRAARAGARCISSRCHGSALPDTSSG